MNYELSSAGDKRFSAFYARLEDGRSIEEHYQCDVKGYQPGGTNWRLGKGKPPIDRSKNLQLEYDALWRRWLTCHPIERSFLKRIKRQGYVFCDKFSSKGRISQAETLYRLIDEF